MPDIDFPAAVRARRPLVHCISNIVTANDCANILYAVGASPMMAEACEEMPEISALADTAALMDAACELSGLSEGRPAN